LVALLQHLLPVLLHLLLLLLQLRASYQAAASAKSSSAQPHVLPVAPPLPSGPSFQLPWLLPLPLPGQCPAHALKLLQKWP
jgi:hypothetical protein